MKISPGILIVEIAVMVAFGSFGGVLADSAILSTVASETLGGLAFDDADLIDYDILTDTSTLFLDNSLFTTAADIDAIYVLSSGNIILSTDGDATLGGMSFGAGDLVEYDPVLDTSSLFFDGSGFSASENIDAVFVKDDGNIILSTEGAATLGSLSFSDGDLVEYDPLLDIATLFFDESLFGGNEDIDAFSLLDDGNLLLSTVGSATLGSLSFSAGDLIEYDPILGNATIFIDGSLFVSAANIDAAFVPSSTLPVPEPATMFFLVFGGLLMTVFR